MILATFLSIVISTIVGWGVLITLAANHYTKQDTKIRDANFEEFARRWDKV